MAEARARRRRGFTLVEVSLGVALAVVVLLVVFEVFLAGRRGTTVLHQSLEANEAVLRTFRLLTRDIRSGREVMHPRLAAPGTPMPDFAWSSATDGTHRIDIEVYRLVFQGGTLVPRTQRVVWYLDEPKELAGGGRTYSLFRAETPFQEGGPAPGSGMGGPPPGPAPGGPLGMGSPAGGAGTAAAPGLPPGVSAPKKVAENVHELIFFRRQEDPATPEPDVGPKNVMVRMVSSRVRQEAGGRQVPGYTAELRTTVHIRGGS